MGRCNSPNITYSTTHKSQQNNKTSKDTPCDCTCYMHACPCRFELYATTDFISDIWQGKGHPRLVSGDHGISTWQKIACTSHFLAGHWPTPSTSPRTGDPLEMSLSWQRNGLCFALSQHVCNIHCCRLKKQWEWQERARRGFFKLTAAYGTFRGLPLIAKTLCLRNNLENISRKASSWANQSRSHREPTWSSQLQFHSQCLPANLALCSLRW